MTWWDSYGRGLSLNGSVGNKALVKEPRAPNGPQICTGLFITKPRFQQYLSAIGCTACCVLWAKQQRWRVARLWRLLHCSNDACHPIMRSVSFHVDHSQTSSRRRKTLAIYNRGSTFLLFLFSERRDALTQTRRNFIGVFAIYMNLVYS